MRRQQPVKPTPLITVSMPTYNVPAHMLRRAVMGVLEQTERRLKLVVVNDGGNRTCWRTLANIKDPRLERIDMPTNVGTYACHSHVLRGCTSRWWSPHDADDHSQPDRYEAMLTAASDTDEILLGGYTNIELTGASTVMLPYEAPRRSISSPYLTFVSVWAGGLWSTDWLRRAGGINGNFRVGYDTALQTLAITYSRIKTVPNTGYIRVRRQASLTVHPSTGFQSEYRRRVCESLDKMFERALGCRSLDEAGKIMAAGTVQPPA